MVQMHLTVPHQQQGPALSRLRAAKDLAADRDRPFAEFTLSGANVLRVTRDDCSNGQVQFVQFEPCLNRIIRLNVKERREMRQCATNPAYVCRTSLVGC